MTTKTQTFTRAVHDGQLYITTEFKGTEYCLHKFDGAWGVGTRRLALGRYNAGGFKRFATLDALAANCKAFGSAEQLAAMYFGV